MRTLWSSSTSSRDGLGNVVERHPDLNVSLSDKDHNFKSNFVATTKSAIDVVLDLLESHPERSVTYIVLGPLTNLATLNRERHQTIRTRIGRVVIMGGALDVPGNTTPVAECKGCVLTCFVHSISYAQSIFSLTHSRRRSCSALWCQEVVSHLSVFS